ncbi:hypothetical protein [Archangium violaceum]|uniref:hypothetical protein n=1 Tax=Archangium violaceum TaxID=83451 RepID=UPI0036DDA1EF
MRRSPWLWLLWGALWWAGCGGVEATGPEWEEGQSAQAVVTESCKAESLSWASSPASSACGGPQEYTFKCYNQKANDSHCPVKEAKTCYEPCQQVASRYSENHSKYLERYYAYSYWQCGCGNPECTYQDCWEVYVYDYPKSCAQVAQEHASQKEALNYTVTAFNEESGYCAYRLDGIPVKVTVYNDPRCPSYNCSTYQTCRHPAFNEALGGAASCGSAAGPHYSAAGMSVDQLKVNPQIVQAWNTMNGVQVPVEFASTACLTCEQQSDPGLKFNCLQEQLGRLSSLPLSTEGRAALEQKLVHHLKLLFETRADVLSNNQRTDAINLYTDKPGMTSQCGTAWTPPAVSAACSVPAELTGTLSMCNLMPSEHVPLEVLPLVFNACFSRTAELISQLPASSCGADDVDKYRTAYMELSTKILLRHLGTMKAPLVTNSTDDAIIEAEDVARRDELNGKLKGIQIWFTAARRFLYPGPEVHDDLTIRINELFKEFWNTVYLEGETGRVIATDADAAATIQDIQGHALRAERQVLRAAFEVPSVSEAPMNGMLLLSLMGDALHGIQQRLEDVSLLHDMSCRFKSCTGTRSRTRQLWGLLGSLHDQPALKTELDAIAALVGSARLDAKWVKPFSAIHARHDVLQAAIKDVLGAGGDGVYNKDHLLSRAPTSLPATASAFTSLVKTARARVRGYDANTLFVLSNARRLEVGLDAQKQASINTEVNKKLSAVTTGIANYRLDRQLLVKGLLGQLESQQEMTNIFTRAQLLHEETVQLSMDLDGLRASQAVDDVRYGDFMKGFELLNAGVAAEGREVLKSERPLSVSPANATYTGPGVVADLASVAVPELAGSPFRVVAEMGDVVNIQVSGQWSPTCALRQTTGFNGSNVKAVAGPGSMAPAMTGPEGFAVTESEGNYYAQGVQTVTTGGTYENWTANVKACAGLSLPKPIALITDLLGLSLSAEACGAFDAGRTWSRNNSTTRGDGSESRSTLTLSRGLRSERTPFPEQPAGSLLLVRTRPQAVPNPTYIPATDILSVQVVRAPTTSLLVDEASDVYFVVNDLKSSSCGTVDPSALTLKVSHLQSEAAAARKIMRAMASAEKLVRDEAAVFVAQGRLLPSQATYLRNKAYDEVYNQCVRDYCSSSAGCTCNNLSQYSESLRNLFETWLSKDIVDIEREVELVNIERRMRALRMELVGLEKNYNVAQQKSRMLALEPAWALRNLEGSELRGELRDLSYVVTHYVEPVVTLRHPELRTRFTDDDKAKLNVLTDVDPLFSDLVDLATKARIMSEMVNSKLESERALGPTQTIHELFISIPRVDKGITSIFNSVDGETAAAIWTKILAGKDPAITLTPEHAYWKGGGQKVLSCTQSAPIINKMALYLVHDSATTYLPYNIQTYFAPEMSFPTTPQLQQYEFVSPNYLAPSVQLMLGWQEQVATDLTTYWAGEGTSVATGLSPFSTISLDLSSFRRSYPNNLDGTLSSDNPLYFANELIVAFRVEPRQESALSKLPGVPECD